MTTTMRLAISLFTLTAAGLNVCLPVQAQARDGLMGDLLKDVAELEKKVMGLAKAMPEAGWAWRPGPGVRSTAEVFQHVAADNYFMPALMNIPAPKETGITATYDTAAAFEKRTMTRDAVVAELEKSFAFLRTSMSNASEAQMNETFGQRKRSGRALWLATVTHLHEHLGQLIAYARSNEVVPPWSK